VTAEPFISSKGRLGEPCQGHREPNSNNFWQDLCKWWIIPQCPGPYFTRSSPSLWSPAEPFGFRSRSKQLRKSLTYSMGC